jgi:hypothetical protein
VKFFDLTLSGCGLGVLYLLSDPQDVTIHLELVGLEDKNVVLHDIAQSM